MKYFSTLFILIALVAVGTTNAQTASKLNGQTYVVVMKDAVNGGEEIIDNIRFENGQLVSEKYSKSGYSSSKFLEKPSGSESNFEVTLKSDTEGSRLYRGKAAGNTIDGTIIITDKSGTPVTYAFRGMTTEEWNKIQEMKKSGK